MRGPKKRGASSSSFSRAMSKNIASEKRERKETAFSPGQDSARPALAARGGQLGERWASAGPGYEEPARLALSARARVLSLFLAAAGPISTSAETREKTLTLSSLLARANTLPARGLSLGSVA